MQCVHGLGDAPAVGMMRISAAGRRITLLNPNDALYAMIFIYMTLRRTPRCTKLYVRIRGLGSRVSNCFAKKVKSGSAFFAPHLLEPLVEVVRLL